MRGRSIDSRILINLNMLDISVTLSLVDTILMDDTSIFDCGIYIPNKVLSSLSKSLTRSARTNFIFRFASFNSNSLS